MKKRIIWVLFIVIFVVILILILSSLHKQRQYNLCQTVHNIKTIEIISVPQYLMLSNKALSEIEPIASVDEDQWSDFLNDFYKTPCFRYINDPAQMIIGNAVRIIYQDGTYEFISEYAGMSLLSNGDCYYTPYYFETETFSNLISSWLQGGHKTGDGLREKTGSSSK